MQTLTAGSFLNLENLECVEALKFTACRLAEHTATVVAEKLTAAALADLANNLWNKAEYVARETERRRLHEIFNENFCERFRELKPEVLSAATSEIDVLSTASTIGNNSLAEHPPAPEIIECDKSDSLTAESAYFTAQPEADQTVTEGKRDEFLGFVRTDEPFAATAIAPDTVEPEAVQATNSEDDQVAATAEVSAENPKIEKSPLDSAPTVAAESNSPATSANKTGANAVATESKEPFDFGKCTVNINLVLLPSSGEAKGRKVIVSATSHNLPPEIDFLEITEGEDLAQISDLVSGKLARFKQTLPVKYIEQLRTSKTKPAKKAATAALAVAAAPTQTTINQGDAEKQNGSQRAQDSSGIESENAQREVITNKENVDAAAAPVSIVPQPPRAANNVQPSLF